MKHLEPFKMYDPSSLFAINEVIKELSEPAAGSVKQKEARIGRSAKGRRNLSFCSWVPCRAITTLAKSLHMAEVEIPVSP